MSKVATRSGPSTTTTTTTSRTATSSARRPAPYPPRAPAAPPTSSARRTEYRVEKIIRDGVATEVITIEDTPEPPPSSRGAGAGAGSTSTYGSSSRYDSYAYEPVYKKRKSDGAHISDHPYADSASYRNNAAFSTSHAGTAGSKSGTGTGSKTKRKLDVYDGYSNSRDSASSQESAQRPAQRVKEKERDQPVHDKEGHFIVRIGAVLEKRYRIVRSLGQGTFGKVVCAFDSDLNREVAVKVIRAVPKYREASKVEIKVLKLIKENDPNNIYKCIHLLDTFDYKNHVCLSTELLSASVFDFLKDNQYQPFPLYQIQEFTKQLLKSVEFLHRLQLIHTDLKPENILLENTASDVLFTDSSRKKSKKILKSTNIRLIDFGSATFESEYHANVVSTRHYRAPEIILGTGWSYPCDAWSIGCILIEFYTGEALFQTHENVEHLAMMERVFGRMPDQLLQKGYTASQATTPPHPEWFVLERSARSSLMKPTKLNFPVTKTVNGSSSTSTAPITSKQSIKFVKQMRPLRQIIRPEDGIGLSRFHDLLENLLQWEPEKRVVLKEALKHPFFNMTIEPDR